MSVTLSPIYAHFSETLTGLATIRAFRDEARFKQENEHRLEINQRANFCGKKIRLRKVLAATKTISRSVLSFCRWSVVESTQKTENVTAKLFEIVSL